MRNIVLLLELTSLGAIPALANNLLSYAWQPDHTSGGPAEEIEKELFVRAFR